MPDAAVISRLECEPLCLHAVRQHQTAEVIPTALDFVAVTAALGWIGQ